MKKSHFALSIYIQFFAVILPGVKLIILSDIRFENPHSMNLLTISTCDRLDRLEFMAKCEVNTSNNYLKSKVPD